MKESYRKDVASDPDSESCWAGRKAPARSQASRAGTGRSHSPPGGSDGPLERPVKENIRPAGKHGYGKSDEPIVSKKPANRIYKHHGVCRGGVGGDKGLNQEEHGPTRHLPDSEPA